MYYQLQLNAAGIFKYPWLLHVLHLFRCRLALHKVLMKAKNNELLGNIVVGVAIQANVIEWCSVPSFDMVH